MHLITADEARKAVKRPGMAKGIDKYCFLMQRVRCTNVFEDADFRKAYDGFYQVRRNGQFRDAYFALMEAMKAEASIDFEKVFYGILKIKGSCEISFASKLAHTLDTAFPIWDSVVTKRHFKIMAPVIGTKNREAVCIDRYKEYQNAFTEYMATPEAGELIEIFDEAFPNNGITDIKKIDFILWQHRE